MSTNANASSGASKKKTNSEMRVKNVSDAEIIEAMEKYTGNPDTVLTADCIIYDVGERNRTDADAPAGSSVNAVATGKQTTEELEKGNSVTIVARDMTTLNKTTKKKPTDTRKEKEEKTEEEK